MRSVPFDIPAERATLGSVLLDREAIVALAGWLTDQHFYLEKHARIYAAMLACYARREPPDAATVAAELRRRDDLDLAGGLSYLGELVDSVPTAMHAAYYARIVEAAALRRRLIEAGGRVAALGYDEAAALADVLDTAEREVLAVRQGQRQDAAVGLGAVMSDLFTRLQAIEQGAPPGLPSGYRDLDELTGGLHPSDLILLAARPSVGKTALMLGIAGAVSRGGAGVGVFSLEMGREQLGRRLLAMHTGIDYQRLHSGRLRPDERERAIAGMAELSSQPLHIDDTAGLSIDEVRARARRMHHEHGIGLLLVDYLQLMRAGGRAENRVQEVSEISRGLKALARELHVPVIALSQLSRAVEARAGHVPQLSDLRESGSLEQDADLVWFLYREELYDRETDRKGIAELHIAKHRNGPLGVVPLYFHAMTAQFRTLDAYGRDEARERGRVVPGPGYRAADDYAAD